MFGISKSTQKPPEPPPAGKTEKKETKPPAEIPDTKTLADIPEAGKEDVGEDPYAQIDKLIGDDLENALARLTPAQRDDYLNRTARPSKRR